MTQFAFSTINGEANTVLASYSLALLSNIDTHVYNADLDQALQKAMQAIGQKPVALKAVEGPSDNEAMLRQRIIALEQQLSSLKSQH